MRYSFFTPFSIAVLCFILLTLIRSIFFLPNRENFKLEKNLDQKIAIEGIIISEPEERENTLRYVIEPRNKESKQTKILVYDHLYAKREYGEQVQVEGKLEAPKNFQSDNGREFNYVSYLAKDGVFYIIRYANVKYIASGQGNKIREIIFTIKKRFIENLNLTIPFPESRLAAGLTIAGKQALPKEIQDEFQITGSSQVVVLSGYNVTIVAETLMSLLAFLPRTIGLLSGASGIILFAIMAGGSATIVRAALMAIIVVLGKWWRKDYNISRALIIAGVIMLLFNPLLLLYDPSFQLSFLATMGIIYVPEVIKKYFTWVTNKIKLQEIVVTTVSAQIFVLPFIMYLIGTTHIFSVLVNLLLALVVPLAMFASFITGLVGFISPVFALPFSLLAFGLLKIMLVIVHFFSLMPLATILFPFPLWLTAIIYGGYTVILVKFYRVA